MPVVMSEQSRLSCSAHADLFLLETNRAAYETDALNHAFRGASILSDDTNDDLTNARISAVIGKRIRAQRKRRGLSSNELGKMVNLTGEYITRCERGERPISSGRLFFMAQALGVPIAYFFNGIATEARVKMAAAESNPEVVEGAAELVMHLAKLAVTMENPQSRALLLTLLDQLPGGQLVPKTTGIPRQKRRVKWYAKLEDPPS